MATPQEFIQPIAQANSPFLANNGNPNTVYNTAATPFGGQAVVAQPTGVPNPAQGWYDISPFGGTNIRQNWSFDPASTELPPSAYADPASRFWNTRTSLAPAQFSLTESGAMWPGGSNPFLPPQQEEPPPAAPPPTGGSSGPPPTNAPPLPHTPPEPQYPGAAGGGFTPQQLAAHTYISTPAGVTKTNSLGSIMEGVSSLVNSIGQGLGFNGRTGGFDVNQFLEAVINVAIPGAGNLYRENTGTWNTQQIARTVLNMTFPGLGRLGAWLAREFRDVLPEGLRNWLDKNDLADIVEETYNKGSGGNYMNVDQSPFMPGFGVGHGLGYGPLVGGSGGFHRGIVEVGPMQQV